jgi:hypothetical protein
MPFTKAGTRIEPPMSDPSAIAAPPDPTIVVAAGRSAGGARGVVCVGRAPIDLVVRLQPVERSRRVPDAEHDRARSAKPPLCGMPSTAISSLIVAGTPSRGGDPLEHGDVCVDDLGRGDRALAHSAGEF